MTHFGAVSSIMGGTMESRRCRAAMYSSIVCMIRDEDDDDDDEDIPPPPPPPPPSSR